MMSEADDFEAPAVKRPKQQLSAEETRNESEPEPEEEEEEEEDDGSEGCPICFEQWSTSGFHRLVSLKCGHLFGKRCIERWLSHPTRTKCPQCNTPAKRGDIRALYAKRLIAMDTGEREELLRLVEEERAGKRGAREAEARANVALLAVQADLQQTRSQLEALKRRLLTSSDTSGLPSLAFEFHRSFQLGAQPAACRCLAFDPYYATFLLGKSTPRGHAIGKISLLDASNGIDYIQAVHTDQIRSINHSPFKDGLVLSTGGDGVLAVCSVGSNSVVHRYKMDAPGWSCAFDPGDANRLFAGLANGTISVFDLRNTGQAVCNLTPDLPRKLPIHTLIAGSLGSTSLVGATMDGPFGYDLDGRQVTWNWSPTATSDSAKGSCTAVSWDAQSDCLLASYRHRQQPAQQHLFHLTKANDVVIAPKLSFPSQSPQTVMSRCALFTASDNHCLVTVIPDEPSASLHFHDLSLTDSPSPSQRLMARLETRSHCPILDVAHGLTAQHGHVVGALTGTDLYVMRQSA